MSYSLLVEWWLSMVASRWVVLAQMIGSVWIRMRRSSGPPTLTLHGLQEASPLLLPATRLQVPQRRDDWRRSMLSGTARL